MKIDELKKDNSSSFLIIKAINCKNDALCNKEISVALNLPIIISFMFGLAALLLSLHSCVCGLILYLLFCMCMVVVIVKRTRRIIQTKEKIIVFYKTICELIKA